MRPGRRAQPDEVADYHFDQSIIITAREQQQYMQVVIKGDRAVCTDSRADGLLFARHGPS